MKTRKNNKNKTKQNQNKIVLKKKTKTQYNKKNKKNRKTVSFKKVQKGGVNSSNDFPDSEKYFGIRSKRAKSTYERQQQQKQHEEMKRRTYYDYMNRKKNRIRIKTEKFEVYEDIAENELSEDIAENELSLDNLSDFFRKQSELYNNKKSYFSMGSSQKREKQREEQVNELQNKKSLNFDTYKGSVREETEYTVDFNPILFEPGDLIFVTQVYKDLTKPGDRGILSPFYYEALTKKSHNLKGTGAEGNPDKLEEQEIVIKETGNFENGKEDFIGHANIQGYIYRVRIPTDPGFDKGNSGYFVRKYRVLTTPLPILLKKEDLYDTEDNNNKIIKKRISDTVINIDKLPSPPNSNMM